MTGLSPLLLFVVVLAFYLLSSIKILAEYERGVIFRLGKLHGHGLGRPGADLQEIGVSRDGIEGADHLVRAWHDFA